MENVYEKKITRPILNLEENNGIITNIWFRDETKLHKFALNNMRYLFVDVGDIGEDGKLLTPEEELTSFIDFISNYEKENDFDFVLLPYNEIILENYDFNSSELRENVIENHVSLIELGFDGAHIDIEAIPFNQREDYLDFLEEIDKNIGKDKMLTVYAGALDEEPNVWAWEPEFYSAVSDRVDIISIQGYDLIKFSKKTYQEELTGQIKKLTGEQWNAHLLFTAPTHKIYPETLESALEIYTLEMEKHKTNNQFIGVAIFAEWTTDEKEWDVFESYKI